MNRAIVIGVSEYSGKLQSLDSINGANSFAKWLTAQGYQCKTITDSNNISVTGQRIRRAIRSIIDEGNTRKLIVYFTGHGILQGTDEFWLLSDAFEDPSAAINHAANVSLARLCGIPNVIFISDACRSTPTSMQLSNVLGTTVFPSPSPGSKEGQIDSWFATLPGSPALELPVDESTATFSSIYTEVFVKTHIDGPKSITVEHQQHGEKIHFVASRKLRDHLAIKLPQLLLDKGVSKSQEPSARIESDPDIFIGRYLGNINSIDDNKDLPSVNNTITNLIRENGRNVIDGVSNSPKRVRPLSGGAGVSRGGDIIQPTLEASTRSGEDVKTPEALRDDLLVSLSLNGSKSFETRTGFSIFGKDIAAVHGANTDIMKVDALRTDIRVYPRGDTESLLLEFTDGSGALLPSLEGYIGTTIVDHHGISNINYHPAGREPSEELQHLRASVAAASNMGVFSVDRENAENLANRIRVGKSIDPTLGLYAAYAYHQVGLSKKVRSVASYMHQFNLFDPQLLERTPMDKSITVKTDWFDVTPICPMFSQGWNLLGVKNIRLPPAVERAGQHRTTSLWTTFNKKGMEILIRAFEEGEILQ